MSDNRLDPGRPTPWTDASRLPPLLSNESEAPASPPRQLQWRTPLLLFIATCLCTLLWGGPIYSLALMTILTAHELGHYLQARRYGVPASLPYFIPMPLPPLGTMGAIIAMRPGRANTRALYDLAITGPLAGLIPALAMSAIGLRLSTFGPHPEPDEQTLLFGTPLVFDWMVDLFMGPVPDGQIVIIHPLAYAGWVGILITALNLMPIGQLDGGHILYSLLPRRAHAVSISVIVFAAVAVVIWQLWHWTLMILLLLFLGLRHPPAEPGGKPLGPVRKALGWLTLPFVIIGFTPRPFIF